MNKQLKSQERTEEIQAIIDRMPNKFGLWITFFILFIVIALGIFGWIIRYPDIVTGQIVINANNSPVKLIANSSGKLFLNKFSTQDAVKEGDYIAIIQNAAKINDIQRVHQLILNFNINVNRPQYFPKDISVGELNSFYFALVSAYDQYIIYNKENLLTKQIQLLQMSLAQQEENLAISSEKLKMNGENLRLIKKSHSRDSTLFVKKVLSESEFDKSEMNYLSAKDAYQSNISAILVAKEQIQETRNRLQQASIQKQEKENQVRLDLMAAYSALSDNFKTWEQKYVFKSPINGQVQFLKFWTNDQFVQLGEQVFTIVPVKNKMIGQMSLPAAGAGKVKPKQEVIIKLDNYPYNEYGSIRGIVSSISLTTNPLKTTNGDIETYLIMVDLPEQLKTNYGSKLDFKFEIRGQGEIITKDRRLIERLFDNLRYTVNR